MKNKNYETGYTASSEATIGAIGNSYPAYVSKPEGYTIPEIIMGKDRELEDGTTEEVQCKTADHYTAPIGGITDDAATALCTGRQVGVHKGDYGHMEELDDMGTNLNHEPVQATKVGCWSYVSTRNNNFSNRSQKGTLCVDPGHFKGQDIGRNGGAISTEDGWMMIDEDALSTIYSVTFESQPSDDSVSPLIIVQPAGMEFEDGKSAEIGIAYTHRALRSPKVMFKSYDEGASWEEISDVEYKEQDGQTVAVVNVNESGHYKVQDEINAGAVAGIVISILALLGAIGLACFMKSGMCGRGNSDDAYSAEIQA